MTQRTELRDVLASIRSKNAGPFAFTIDVFFKQETDWQAVVDQAVLTPDTVSDLYTIEPERIRVHNFKPALAIKVAIKRDLPAGSPGDRDIFSGQQFVPVLGVTFDRVKNALRGVRVLDLSSVMMGPYATQVLADQGADVVCVEGPQISTQRQLGPGTHPEFSGIAVNLLRNKRSVQLDLRADHGRRAFLALAASCDIVITNLRASSLAKLGVAYDDVARVHPGVVWCEAHGYSAATGDPDAPMYDDIAQAAAGLPHLMVRGGLTDAPRFLPTVLADKVCAFAIAEAVLAGLVQRSRTGTGLRIELAMVDVMRSFVLAEHGAGAVFEPEVGEAGYARVLAPDRRPYATTDGYVAVMPYSPADWHSVFRAFDRDDLADDGLLASHRDAIVHAPDLYSSLGRVLRDFSTAECLRRFAEAGVACSPLATLEEMLEACELLDHPVAGRYRYLPTGITSNSPDGDDPVRPAPRQGEHTVAALREAGVAEDDVAACLADLEGRAVDERRRAERDASGPPPDTGTSTGHDARGPHTVDDRPT